MQQALLIRLRPAGPWRFGPSDGASDRSDELYRSDRLFSAVTLAMRRLGLLESWLDATARRKISAVAFSSLFPFQNETLFVTPPLTLWPPPSSQIQSPSSAFLSKIRWRAARFIPTVLADALLTGQPVLADQWIPDPESGCLLRRDRPGASPFRSVSRAIAPVDRLSQVAGSAGFSACLEFEAGSGLWAAARFFNDIDEHNWREPLSAALRLLADTGFGGGRSRGWGQVQSLKMESGAWPALVLPKVSRIAQDDVHQEQTSRAYWFLSLYSPAPADTVNWSGGQYELTVRTGRLDGANGALKKSARMVAEGGVVDAAAEPLGAAIDVSPNGFAHPVYCSGIALSLMLPLPQLQNEDRRGVEQIVPPELEAKPFVPMEIAIGAGAAPGEPFPAEPVVPVEPAPEPPPQPLPDPETELPPLELPVEEPSILPPDWETEIENGHEVSSDDLAKDGDRESEAEIESTSALQEGKTAEDETSSKEEEHEV